MYDLQQANFQIFNSIRMRHNYVARGVVVILYALPCFVMRVVAHSERSTKPSFTFLTEVGQRSWKFACSSEVAPSIILSEVDI